MRSLAVAVWSIYGFSHTLSETQASVKLRQAGRAHGVTEHGELRRFEKVELADRLFNLKPARFWNVDGFAETAGFDQRIGARNMGVEQGYRRPYLTAEKHR